ncbi:MAG: hypothetical protein A2X36_10410 [Elusimicrobia bacterium GWA2_69_24]|nr:MAG: hypothetical protein A2X36_10410 [Elusimicrobia bacterium GWA2_69_24]HBL18270.1 hypothetical protein [Elusimicrobiota bacterium]
MAHRRPPAADIRFAAFVKAKPEDVYRSLTSARELCVWWLDRAETDARNTGRVRMVWPARKATKDARRQRGQEVSGVFVDLDPGRKVAWMLDEGSRAEGVPPLVSLFIEKAPRGSQVTLIHAGFPGAASKAKLRDRYRQSWEDCVAKLKLYLDQGKLCKEDVLTLADVELLRRAGRRR